MAATVYTYITTVSRLIISTSCLSCAVQCPVEDQWYCGSQWPEAYCEQFTNVPQECPYMCGVCSEDSIVTPGNYMYVRRLLNSGVSVSVVPKGWLASLYLTYRQQRLDVHGTG